MQGCRVLFSDTSYVTLQTKNKIIRKWMEIMPRSWRMCERPWNAQCASWCRSKSPSPCVRRATLLSAGGAEDMGKCPTCGRKLRRRGDVSSIAAFLIDKIPHKYKYAFGVNCVGFRYSMARISRNSRYCWFRRSVVWSWKSIPRNSCISSRP